MSSIRVLIVDDHPVVREGLRSVLAYYPDLEVIGEAQDGLEAIARVHELRPDVVLMDIAMPEMSGLEATREIHKQYPFIRVLVLTQHEDRQYLLPVLQAGALGYILKRARSEELVNALRTVARGEMFLHPSMMPELLQEVRETGERAIVQPVSLTPREREILKHIAQGETNPQIAAALSLSVKTIDWHRGNIMDKLGLHTVAQLVRYAIQYGLIPNHVEMS